MAARRLAFKGRFWFCVGLLGLALSGLPLVMPAAAAIDLGEISPILRPDPPPPSPFMSPEDFMILDAAFEAVRDDDWAEALDLANLADDHVGRDLIRWLWVQDRDGEAPFAAIVRFLSEHPDWPRQSTLLRRAEEALPEDMPAAQVIAWFAGNEPVTGNGKLRLATAYLDQDNDAFARHWIRQAWVNHDFSTSDERRLLTRYGDYLDDSAHIERAERLLWEHQYNSARRVRSHVPTDFRRLMDAWLALIALDSNASSRVAGVPEQYRDHPGLLYERIRWRRRKNRDEETWPMLAAAPTTAEELGEPERWWTERHLQARNALRESEYQAAYDMVAGHGMTSGSNFAEAEWLAGWIALRFLNQPDDAFAHFERLAAGVSYPISRARAFYWMGRAAEEADNQETARPHYITAAAYPTTYYGQLAMEQLGGAHANLSLPQPPAIDEARRAELRQDELVHAAELLSDLATERLLFSWFLHLGEVYDDPQDLQIIADMGREFGQWHMAVRVGKLAMFQHIYLTETTYPLIEYEEMETAIPLPEMALVLGLSRQESEFNPAARSSAGARGLMQLIPSTARTTARRMGIAYNTAWLTETPSYNAQLGRYHLGELLDQFEGSYIMTLAAYNAGPHRVDRWVREYGDPRTGEIDPIDWVELIPYRETRNYVQRVLENTMIYRNRLTGADLQVTMTADLARANGQPPVMLASLPAPQIEVEDTEVSTASETEAPVEIIENIVEAVEPLPTEGTRVVVTIDAADLPPRITPPLLPRQTLREPETQIWTIPENCTAYVLHSSGDEEGSCEDS